MRKGRNYVEIPNSDIHFKKKRDIRVNKGNYRKTKFFLKTILGFLIVFVVIVPFTYARYTDSRTVQHNVRVATWSFKIGDSTSVYNIDLADTITENNYSSTKVVPGTCGIIQFSIDFRSTKVDTAYQITIDSTNTNLPANLKLYTDSDYTTLFTGYSGTVTLNNISSTLLKRIYWKWDFTNDDENSWANQQIKLSLKAEAQQEVS
ncbi:MAG: hypothetical protein IJ193_07645 [Bacilli bacterium]|nr:hypothetical protein [Bacilli bacterium]